jgi:putative tRNA adenosine deaminase-associated protein
VAYFTAVVVQVGGRWRARDIEIDEAETLDELVDVLRDAVGEDGRAMAMVEHEDDWFALVRVDGDEDPRVFVSNLEAAGHSIFAAVLGSVPDATEEDETEDDEPVAGEVWAGEIDLLADLGVSGGALHALVGEFSDDPGTALGRISEAIGCADLLQSLR